MSEVAVLEQGADVEVVVPMDRRSAERLDQRIRQVAGTVRDNFVKLAAFVEEAKAGNIHEVLGFASWTAYLADALGGQLEVRGPVRLEVVQFLAGEGMSTRGIAAITGASKSTIANDLAQVSNSGHVDSDGDQSAVPNGTPADEQKTVGLDGKEYRKPKPRKKPEPKPVEETAQTEDTPRHVQSNTHRYTAAHGEAQGRDGRTHGTDLRQALGQGVRPSHRCGRRSTADHRSHHRRHTRGHRNRPGPDRGGGVRVGPQEDRLAAARDQAAQAKAQALQDQPWSTLCDVYASEGVWWQCPPPPRRS